MRVVKVSRFNAEAVEERLLVVDGGERVVVRVVICDVRDARVGRIGMEDMGVVVAGERPKLVSRAVRRSEIIARELMVEVGGETPFGSDGAVRRDVDCKGFILRLDDSLVDRAASADIFSPSDGV